MYDTMTNFILDIIRNAIEVAKLLTEPLPYINISPLAIFSIGGVVALLTIHLLRLFVGG